MMRDGMTAGEACRRLEDADADVVGLNCSCGPATVLPLLAEIRPRVSAELAALPVPYRTTAAQSSMQSLRDPSRHERPFPARLDPFTCTRDEIAEFAGAAQAVGANYIGLCCGAGPHHIRALAEALGGQPPASRYAEDMSQHAYLGTGPATRGHNQDYAGQL